jgi:hypothetical protein
MIRSASPSFCTRSTTPVSRYRLTRPSSHHYAATGGGARITSVASPARQLSYTGAMPDSQPADHAHLRASDADRERVARVLHDAMGEGRLSVHELDVRLKQTYEAVTFGELETIAYAVMGGGEIDLREARFIERTTTIRAFAVMGGIEIIVPEGITVRIQGIGIMGSFDHSAAHEGPPDAPVVHISGLAFWGGVEVKRRQREQRGTTEIEN